MKYLIVFIVVIGVLLLLKRGQQRDRHRRPPAGASHAEPEQMLPCRHCGVHLPASRCVWRDGEPYCCAEHADMGR